MSPVSKLPKVCHLNCRQGGLGQLGLQVDGKCHCPRGVQHQKPATFRLFEARELRKVGPARGQSSLIEQGRDAVLEVAISEEGALEQQDRGQQRVCG